MSDTPREDAYDEHIAPLMTQIIALCKEHGIPMAMTFELDLSDDSADDEDPLMCSTILIDNDKLKSCSKRLRAVAKAMRPERPLAFTEMTVTRPDGSKETTIRQV
jgi:hypothetical protein